MAELARNYHNDLQANDLAEDVTEEEYIETLNFIKPKLTPSEKAPLAEYLTHRECHGFINPCGLAPRVAAGAGAGWSFVTPAQPVPVTRVPGFCRLT